MDLEKLSLSVQPILSNFEPDPRFFALLGVGPQQQHQIRDILLEQKQKQDDLETSSFRLLDQEGGNATFVVENTAESAGGARKRLEAGIAKVIGPNPAKVFIQCADGFFANNALYTDGVKVFVTEVLPPQLAKIAGASRKIDIYTLSREFVPPDGNTDAAFIKRARASNLMGGGEGWFANEIPDRMRHLIEKSD